MLDAQGRETLHLIKQADGTIMDVTQRDHLLALSTVAELLAANDINSLPKREIAIDPIDGRYYYYTAIPVMSENQMAGVVVVGTSLNTVLPLLKKHIPC